MVTNLSFDDENEEDLYVFSGNDLLTAHHDHSDLAWDEVAQRCALDERRGLVITQAVALEDLLAELVLYLADPPDSEGYRAKHLDGRTLGTHIAKFEGQLEARGLRDADADAVLDLLGQVRDRRNDLAHGTTDLGPVEPFSLQRPQEWVFEWVLTNRKTGTRSRITMAQLRIDLQRSITCFMHLLVLTEGLVGRVPPPKHFQGGYYVGGPTP